MPHDLSPDHDRHVKSVNDAAAAHTKDKPTVSAKALDAAILAAVANIKASPFETVEQFNAALDDFVARRAEFIASVTVKK